MRLRDGADPFRGRTTLRLSLIRPLREPRKQYPPFKIQFACFFIGGRAVKLNLEFLSASGFTEAEEETDAEKKDELYKRRSRWPRMGIGWLEILRHGLPSFVPEDTMNRRKPNSPGRTHRSVLDVLNSA